MTLSVIHAGFDDREITSVEVTWLEGYAYG